MTTEEYFEEWWATKELPENGFNKTAMLDFAEMFYHRSIDNLYSYGAIVEKSNRTEYLQVGVVRAISENEDKGKILKKKKKKGCRLTSNFIILKVKI